MLLALLVHIYYLSVAYSIHYLGVQLHAAKSTTCVLRLNLTCITHYACSNWLTVALVTMVAQGFGLLMG